MGVDNGFVSACEYKLMIVKRHFDMKFFCPGFLAPCWFTQAISTNRVLHDLQKLPACIVAIQSGQIISNLVTPPFVSTQKCWCACNDAMN